MIGAALPLAAGALLAASAAAIAGDGTGAPTFAGEAGAILARRCVGCHRTGQPGRVPLDTWEQARRFASEIRLVVGMRKMPPWPAVPEFGHFANDRSLTLEEIETLIRWTDTGTQRGDGASRLKPEPRPASLGVDLAYPSSYPVPATGTPDTRCFAVKPQLQSAVWVRGIDAKPGDARVVLYVRAFADPDGSGERSDRLDPAPGYDCYGENSSYLERPVLGEWSPGAPLQLLPATTARRLQPGHPVVIEIRYGRIGHPVEDRTHVTLLLAKDCREVARTSFITKQNLPIPPDAWSFRSEAEWTPGRDLTLVSLIPAMSALGTDFKAWVVLPGGQVRPLVWVHDYDQNWQISYVLKAPMAIPAGSTIRVVTEFDNFETNPKAVKGAEGKAAFSLGLETVSPVRGAAARPRLPSP